MPWINIYFDWWSRTDVFSCPGLGLTTPTFIDEDLTPNTAFSPVCRSAFSVYAASTGSHYGDVGEDATKVAGPPAAREMFTHADKGDSGCNYVQHWFSTNKETLTTTAMKPKLSVPTLKDFTSILQHGLLWHICDGNLGSVGPSGSLNCILPQEISVGFSLLELFLHFWFRSSALTALGFA